MRLIEVSYLVTFIVLLLVVPIFVRGLDNYDIAAAPEACSAMSSDMVLVSTLDGRITALRVGYESGAFAWDFKNTGGPLLSSTINNMMWVDGSTTKRLIPSLDGNLYTYNGAVLEGIPINTDTLLGSSFHLGGDVVAGGKDIKTFGVDGSTGQIVYECSSKGCVHNDILDENGFPRDTSEEQPTSIVMRRTTQTVRAVMAKSGIENWNVSVSHYEMLLASKLDESPMYNSCDAEYEDDCVNNAKNCYKDDLAFVEFKLYPPDGRVVAIDSRYDDKILWEYKLDAPIAQAWHYNGAGHKLNEISLFNPEYVPALDQYGYGDNNGMHPTFKSQSITLENLEESVIYFGTYNNAPYVLASKDESQRMRFISVNNQNHPVSSPEQRRARLYLLNSAAQYSLAEGGKSSTRRIEADQDPNNPALPNDDQCINNPTSCPTCSTDQVNSLILRDQYPRDMGWYLYKQTPPISNMHRHFLSVGDEKKPKKRFKKPEHWEYVAIGLLILLVLSLVGAVCVLWYWFTIRHRGTSKSNEMSSNSNSVTETTGNVSNATTRVSSADSLGSSTTSPEYQSRYLTDFDHLRCLGKGGFGIVYEAKNKVDDVNYAVKRIALLDRPAAKDKVMREVRTLANLEHPGIIRYFQSWLESPPIGWQEEHDKLLFSAETDNELNLLASGPDVVGVSEISKSKELSSTASFSQAGSKLQVDLDGSLPDMLNLEIPEFNSDDFSYRDDTFSCDDSVTNNNDDKDMYSSSTSYSMHSKNMTCNDDSFNIVFGGGDLDCSKPLPHPLPIVDDFDSNDSYSIRFQDDSDKLDDKNVQSNNSGEKRIDNAIDPPEKSVADQTPQTKKAPFERIYLYIQMELCQAQTLRHWLAENRTWESRDRVKLLFWFEQVVMAIKYIHAKHMLHRDLKPSNIFFSATGHVKIGDFGLAKAIWGLLEPNKRYANQKAVNVPYGDLNHTDRVGTHLYMSPEQATSKSYTQKIDIFALGLILFEMFEPFSTESMRIIELTNLRKGKLPKDFVDTWPNETRHILTMVSNDPNERPDCVALIKSDLFDLLDNADDLDDDDVHTQAALIRQRSRNKESRSSD